MSFMDNYVDVATRLKLALKKWPDYAYKKQHAK
jgi:hypothetical protein